MRTALADIPAGVASMTDRVVPLLFPTTNEEVFTATLEQALGVNRPPPRGWDDVGTLYESLDTLSGNNFFTPGTRHRLVVLFTDGETRPYYVPTLREALARGPKMRFEVVRFWDPDERVWNGETPERSYRPDRNSARMIAQLARITGASTFEERDLGRAIATGRQLLGTGPLAARGEVLEVISLARWFALAALVPLAFLLWRRNLV
jgi:hypothetical protein